MNFLQKILQWDKLVFTLINKNLHVPVIFSFFEILTNLADVIIVILAVYWVYLYFFKKKQRERAFLTEVFIIIFITVVATFALKALIHRQPPISIAKQWTEINLRMIMFSFPSGHASRVFALATAMAAEFPAENWIFFSGAAIIGFSRVYVGAHYPLDVFGGAFLGISIVWLYKKVKEKNKYSNIKTKKA